MNLFKADLFRSFAVGFVLGAIGLAMVMGPAGDDMGSTVVPHVLAAPVQDARS